MLQRLQHSAKTKVEITDTDYPQVHDVDRKLIELGKALGGKVVTNDYNLNRMAELSGAAVLNINELAGALKPVALPGELMHVHVLREGKEAGQGVAYLDDGTMVVIEHGEEHLGQPVDVTVTSVLQTSAGRMIFTRLRDDGSTRGTVVRDTAVLVPAGGIGAWLGSATPKQFLALGACPSPGRDPPPLHASPGGASHRRGGSGGACEPGPPPAEAVRAPPALPGVAGASTRQASVERALHEVPAVEFVVVHDAVRPFVTRASSTRCWPRPGPTAQPSAPGPSPRP